MLNYNASTPLATFNLSGKVKQREYNVKDYGVKGDGVTDDTAAIQALINLVITAGGGVLFFPRGVYLISATLNMVGNYCTLRGEAYNRDYSDYPAFPTGLTYGAGLSVIKVAPSFTLNTPMIVVNTSGSIWYQMSGGIEQLCLNGDAAALGSSPNIKVGNGIEMYNAHDFKIRNVTVERVNAKGIYAKGTLPGGVSQDEIEHCLIRDTGWYGVHFDTGMIINWIRDNFIAQISGAGVYNQSNNNYIQNNNIEGPTAHASDFSITGSGIVNTGASCFIEHNQINISDYHGIWNSGVATMITDNACNQVNNLSHADGSGIYLSDGDSYGVVVADNALTDNRSKMVYGVYDNSSVNGANISGNNSYGYTTSALKVTNPGLSRIAVNKDFPDLNTRTTVANANYTVLIKDSLIAYTSINAARTVTLPTAIGVKGRTYIIKDESGSVTATNTITIATTSGQTIDGSATAVIKVPYVSLTLYSNGTNWNII